MWSQCPGCKLVQQAAPRCAHCGQPLPAPPPPPPSPATAPPPAPALAPYLPLGARVRSERARWWARFWVMFGLLPVPLLVALAIGLGYVFRAAERKQADEKRARRDTIEEAQGSLKQIQQQLAETEAALQNLGHLGRTEEAFRTRESLLTKRRELHKSQEGAKAALELAQRPPPPPPGGQPAQQQQQGSPWLCVGPLLGLAGLYIVCLPFVILYYRSRARTLEQQETEYGLAWARMLQHSEKARRAFAATNGVDSEQQLRDLLALVPAEPDAYYMGFENVQPRTCTCSDPRAQQFAVDMLKCLIFRNLLALGLPDSSVSWTTFDHEWMGLYRVDYDANIRLEVCFTVRRKGNILTMFWNSYSLWLYPGEVKTFFAVSPKDPQLGHYVIAAGDPANKHVRYGHTAVWVLVNLFRSYAEWMNIRYSDYDLHPTVKAGVQAIVAKIDAEIESALAELSRLGEMRPPSGPSPPSSNVNW